MVEIGQAVFPLVWGERCAECNLPTSVTRLFVCGECDDLCCENCCNSCDCVSDGCVNKCHVCDFFQRICCCPDECGAHYCGSYCPDCFFRCATHLEKCEFCDICDSYIPQECPHDWHKPNPLPRWFFPRILFSVATAADTIRRIATNYRQGRG